MTLPAPTPLPAAATIFASLRNLSTTNCPRITTSKSLRQFQLNFTNTLTANSPKTAPEAPKLTVAAPPMPSTPPTLLGNNNHDATFAPIPVTRYDIHTPKAPSSSSTSFPKMYKKKMFELKCAQFA